MRQNAKFRWGILWILITGTFLVPFSSNAQPSAGSAATNEIRIVELQGRVEVSPAGARTWVLTQTNQLLYPFDRLRTGPNSRVALRWSDESVVPFGASTELEILPPHGPGAQAGLHLVRGVISFFHRDKPGRIRVITRGAVAGVEGTEFVLGVNDADRTTLSVIDGRVTIGNERGSLVLTNGEQAIVDPGQSPVRTAGFVANNLLQWAFYYPAVLDVADLSLSSEEQSALAESLDAYRSGDLLAALARYPEGRPPGSESERLYHAALLLSVGQVDRAEVELGEVSAGGSERGRRLAASLGELIAAVKRQPADSRFAPEFATEFLARSYYEQSRATPGESLESARTLARGAVERSPQFGFAAARLAELEFSAGRRDRAEAAVETSLELAPRNAQALALKGFLLAAQNRSGEAIEWFNEALTVDSALGNAWLGRGLCRIRRGDARAGREDLLIAAALEPQRAELRSYLGKAYGDTGNFSQAISELDLAKRLDPQDPTAWLYSALINYEHNRINEAVRDLERSQALNDNRGVYRSQLLLDQDQAVRSANLARIYRDAGMTDVSVWEAGRAVNADYGNYSAHLFLGGSLSPGLNLISRRYETAAQQEFLVANLLAPASAGTLSPGLSQSEYSRLLERNRFGLVANTEYLSRGAWSQSGAQYGRFEKLSYDLNWLYATDPGQRVNNDLELWRLGLQLKGQLTAADSVFVKVTTLDSRFGDLAQRYDPEASSPHLRAVERQEPILSVGYHREWAPGIHTLFLASRLHDEVSITNPAAGIFVASRPDVITMPGVTYLAGLGSATIHEDSRHGLEIYSTELQQIWQGPAHTTIVGGRFQYGHFDADVVQQHVSPPFSAIFPPIGVSAVEQDEEWLFKRFTGYAYHNWQLFDSLQLVGGLTYDWMQFPENFWFSPVSRHSETVDQVSPKAGIIWNPARDTVVRLAYTRSMGGAASDQSFQIEPSQIAGFVQSYRTIMPENVVGSQSGANFETYAVSFEQKFRTGTYLGVSGEFLYSDLRRSVGGYDMLPDQLDLPIAAGLRQQLDYREHSLTLTANQLLGNQWSLGGRYRLSQAVLHSDFVEVPDAGVFLNNFEPRSRQESVLHNLALFAIYNHRCGFFTRSEALWYAQSDEAYAPLQPGDDFWHFNAFAGYRFPRRRAELTVGILNIGDQNYKLRPLNLHADLPRERTLMVRLRLDF